MIRSRGSAFFGTRSKRNNWQTEARSRYGNFDQDTANNASKDAHNARRHVKNFDADRYKSKKSMSRVYT